MSTQSSTPKPYVPAVSLTKRQMAAAQRFANGKVSVQWLAAVLTTEELREVAAMLRHNLAVIADSQLFAYDAPRERWTACVAELDALT